MTHSTPTITTAAGPTLGDTGADAARGAVDAAAEHLRAELEGLVRIAARRPNLTVREGDPGCNWSFTWDSDVVTVDPQHLRTLAPDLCRGLALHEASHAAVTVLHRVLPETLLVRLLPLLNAIEDIRIEVWMRSRFPGAAPWIRAYNDVFFGFNRGSTPPRSRQVQFLVGILELWWYGTLAPTTLPDVRMALDECHDAISAATGCQPPLDDDAAGILASQRAMWEIVRRRILPTWARLVALDRREGIGPLAAAELQRFAQLNGCGHEAAACRSGPGRRRPGVARSRHGMRCGRGRRHSAERSLPARLSRRLAAQNRGPAADAGGEQKQEAGAGSEPRDGTPPVDGTDHYLAAWQRIGSVADRLGDELLRLLVPRQRLRWSPGHPWGPRLDLRRAMQFEADPQQYRRLWSRPILPHRRDPAVLLLVDRSSSMREDDRMSRALEGTVLLAEVCRRIGVPAAVWSFARSAREELAWDAAIDGPARRRLGLLPETCAGNTDMATALALVGRAFAGRPGDPKLLFMISDGCPDHHEATLAAVRSLDEEGVVSVGLGLGPGTAGLARYFPNSVTEIPPERLVDHVAGLLGEALLANV